MQPHLLWVGHTLNRISNIYQLVTNTDQSYIFTKSINSCIKHGFYHIDAIGIQENETTTQTLLQMIYFNLYQNNRQRTISYIVIVIQKYHQITELIRTLEKHLKTQIKQRFLIVINNIQYKDILIQNMLTQGIDINRLFIINQYNIHLFTQHITHFITQTHTIYLLLTPNQQSLIDQHYLQIKQQLTLFKYQLIQTRSQKCVSYLKCGIGYLLLGLSVHMIKYMFNIPDIQDYIIGGIVGGIVGGITGGVVTYLAFNNERFQDIFSYKKEIQYKHIYQQFSKKHIQQRINALNSNGHDYRYKVLEQTLQYQQKQIRSRAHKLFLKQLHYIQ